MAELLAKWLNEEIRLSKTITNFEEDFCSGYLFGELLYKFNQQDNFVDFSMKDNITTKVKNFEKLEPTLRNLQIKFDSQSVDKIMKKERGYALRLLYQLKMILEKVYPPTDITILRKTGKNGDSQPAMKIGSQKQAYNKMQSTFFKVRLQALNKPQKQSNMERHLKKFQDEADRQADEAQAFNDAKKADKEQEKQEIRRAQINKLQRNAGFMEEWLQKGVEDWKQNMAYKKEREQSQLEFEYKQASKLEYTTVTRIDAARTEVEDGIEQFEQTLIDNNINPEVTEEFANNAIDVQKDSSAVSKATLRTQKMTQSLLSRPTMGLGGTMTKTGGITLGSVGLRSKAKKPLTDKERKDRERRRMRMITDQMGLLHTIEKDRREQEVLERMKRQSKQEEELAYEAWRTNQCKAVLEENRKLREAKYQRRQELDIQNAVFKEKSMLDSMQEQMTRDISILNERDEFLRTKDKEAKKLRQTTECAKMVEAILDIANEAYIHQQKQDSGEIDERNWHEWQQLFIEGAPIIQAEAQTEASTVVSHVDNLELVDYLENKGQWPTSIVSDNKPKLADLMGAGEPAAAAKGKGKGAAAAETALDEADMVIDDVPVSNTLVGDAVEQIININNEDRGRELRPKNPHYLNLKLCLVGYAFAGKKSQAERLKATYGLDPMNLSDLVEEAIQFYEQNPEPIVVQRDVNPIQESVHEESREENEPAHAEDEAKSANAPAEGQDDQPPAEEPQKQLGENPMFFKSGMGSIDGDDANSVQSEVEEETNEKEDFRLCGQKIKEVLYEGSEISDQLYVDLFIAKLRMSYEYKDKETLRQKLLTDAKKELELTRLLAKLGSELGELKAAQRSPSKDGKPQRKKKRTVEVVQAEIKEKQQELLSIKNIENTGWILVDFPSNFSQAMLLEKSLSGYVIPADLEPTIREKEQKEASLLVKPTAKPEPPKTLIPSGLDAVVWFDCKRDECLRRALGRRIDVSTGNRYHIEDEPPSIEQSPLCEEIQPVDEQSESTACLLDRWVAFDQTSSGLEKWITQFGDEATNSNLMVKVDANGKNDDTYEQIDQVLKQIIKRKEKNNQFLRSTLQANLIREEELEQERLRAEAEAEDIRKAKEDAAKAAGEELPDDGSMSKTPRNLTKSMMGSKSFQEGSQFTSSDFVHERDNIDGDFKATLMSLWKKISTGYKEQMCLSLGKQRVQRDSIQENLNTCQQQFLSYLHRLDNKQEVLSQFMVDFNEFTDNYSDMREDDQTKEELHQRADILSDELWEIAEDRKEQAIEERKKIMESGWIESAQEYITSVAQQMMQSEVDKFRGLVQLMWDYYHAIDEKLIPEISEIPAFDILAVPEGQPPLELPQVEAIAEGADALALDSYGYPRLDELYKRSIKAQVVPDMAALAAAAQQTKKAGKKDPKAKGGAAQEDELKESIYLSEMKEAIKNEKAILRFRLTQIRNWTFNRLKLQREQSIQIYKKLDDWIQVSYKAENDAIEQVCDVIKEAIEAQTKIQSELRLKFMDFVVDKSYHNYIDPPPPKLAAMEEVKSNRLTIPQLKALVSELAQLAEGTQILNRDAIEVLVRKSSNSKSLGDNGGLPKDWSNYAQKDFEKMVRNLDVFNEGSIDYRALATCLMLLQSDLPTNEVLHETKVALQSEQVGLDCLSSKTLWFEKSEASKDRDYSLGFDRITELKEILFSLYASQDQMMSAAGFIAVLNTINTNYQTKLNQTHRAVILKLGAKNAAKQPAKSIGNKFIDVLLCE